MRASGGAKRGVGLAAGQRLTVRRTMPYPCLRFLPSLLASARSSGAAKKCTLCDKPVYEMERYERKEKVSRAWLGRLSFESSGGEQRLLPTVDALYAPLALSSLCCLDIPPVLLRVPPLRLVADRRGRRLDRGARWQGHRHLQRHRGEAPLWHRAMGTLSTRNECQCVNV